MSMLTNLLSGLLGAILGGLVAGFALFWQTREAARSELRSVTWLFYYHASQQRTGVNPSHPVQVWSVPELQDRMVSAFFRYRPLVFWKRRKLLDAAWLKLRGVGESAPIYQTTPLRDDDHSRTRIQAMLDAIDRRLWACQ